MASLEFDLFVIGAGSGGVRAARLAAQAGARVAVAEAAALGGTCVNLGCIPKKLYSYAAHFAEDFEQSLGYGWALHRPSFDWDTLKARRAAEITRLNGVYRALLVDAGVTILHGRARLVQADADSATVEIGGQRHRTRHVLVATGSVSQRPPVEGHEWTVGSDQMFDLPEFPRRLAIIGGGYIACEFASIFNGLGAEVTLLYRGHQLLRGFDDDVRFFLGDEMGKKGVDLRFRAEVHRIARQRDVLGLTLRDGSSVEADAVLAATGRVPNTAGLGLAEAGVELAPDGAVVVDEQFATRVPSVHAVGDVIARHALTPVALAEAMVLVDRLFGAGTRTLDYDGIPTAVFTHPPVATVGLSEAEARARHGDVRVFRSEFRPLKHTLSGSTERTMMKLVVDAASDRVVGLHMVGADAAEIVQGFAVALKAGATKAQFDATVGIHPSAAEEFVTMRSPVMA